MTSIIQQVRRHALHSPRQIAITYLHNDGNIEQATWAEVAARATSVANHLRGVAGPGSRAVLTFPHGLDFVWALLGCLSAGISAVPCAPPAPRRKRTGSRLSSIMAHARPQLVLTAARSRTVWLDELAATVDAQVIETDRIDFRESIDLVRDPDPLEPAFIQYTSGSTSDPKGVIITHGNLAANEEAIRVAFEHDRDSTMISWLPMFHDMGLVGGILQPLFVGFHTVLFSPVAFLAEPLRWLEAVSRYRGTTTGAPNFAYDLCVKAISDEQKAKLDLSSLRVAYNGSEPVKAETLDRFSAAFAGCGFRAEAFFPCYGMAEATLFVSGGPPQHLSRRKVSRAALELHQVVPADGHGVDAVELAASGRPARDTEIAIVDAQSLRRCEPNRVGEIWIRGPGVGAGYFRDAESTSQAFEARLDGEGARYLRTGDLGFVGEHGELYVTGRLKDVIIVAGRNLYPQDLEACAAAALELPPQFHCAAVSSHDDGHEQISIVIEANGALRAMIAEATSAVDETQDSFTLPAIEDQAARIRQAVLEEFGVLVERVAFVRTGHLPMTTSGKVRRSACRAMLEAEDANVLYVSRRHQTVEGDETTSSTWTKLKQMLAGMITPEQRASLDPTDSRTASLTLDDLGVDSLARVSFAAELERQFGVRLDPAEGLRNLTLKQLMWRIDRAAQPAGPKFAARAERLATRHLPPIDSRITSLTDFADRQSRDMLAKTSEFRSWLDDADARGFKRYLLPVIDQNQGRAIVEGGRYEGQREVILFASADYLGLAHDDRVKRAAAETILAHGCNVASVPLIAGSTPVHKLLEQELSDLVGAESCVLFPTGHSANMATIAALCSPHDTVVVDNRVHYSILEGARLAHCQWTTFLHNSPESLREVLSSVRSRNDSRGVLVVLEGVYGIDGDLARLPELIDMAREFDARVMLDDAHGIGVLGPHGEGTAAHLGCRQDADIVMGSLSKALGSFGGFIAATQDTVDYLRFFAKAISFAVGLPSSHAAAARQSLAIIRQSPQRMAELRRKARLFRDALIAEGFAECAVSESTIMSIEIGDEMLLRDVVRELFDQGIWAEGLPFPAVARGKERVRFRVRCDHADDDLLRAAATVCQVYRHVVGRARSGRSPVEYRDGFEQLVVTHLAPQQLEDLCDAFIRQAQQRRLPLAWISREFIAKYFTRSSYWNELASERTWHLGYRFGKLVTAFQVDRAAVARGETAMRAALLGSIVCAPGCEADLRRQMLDAAGRLPPDVECCVTPAAYPVQVFGCGLQSWQVAGGKPFLETSYPEQLLRDAEGDAFPCGGTKRYWRVELGSPTSVLEERFQDEASGEIVVRDFRRPEFVAEIDRIAPILDRTIGQLELCAPLPRSVLQGLVQDLRELVLPGFWLIAEKGDRTIGFAFCYPNLTAEFERIGGQADVADFQRVQQAMESAREVFLAWLAVDPDFAGQRVAARLLTELRSRLLDRGCTHAWVSWELVDGALTPQQLAGMLGTVVQTVEMPYFVVPILRGPAPIVPDPHFSKCDADIFLRGALKES